MSTYRTEMTFSPSKARITLSDSILTLGSCFSDAIGLQLVANKLATMTNPFGVVYNPHSIHKVIHYAINPRPVSDSTFVERDRIFFNYDFHSQLSSQNLDQLKDELEKKISATHTFLRRANWLVITYGTAWVFELTQTKQIVANCQKMPSSLFTKSLMTQKQILESFEKLFHDLKSLNPGLQIILTVSPVRHLKDTLELNSVSKSVLRVACHTITQQHQDVHYFPSYEIMLDDLRDYRFYKADMIHPSDVAEAYIWQKFGEKYFDNNMKSFVSKWAEIKLALSHKSFHPTSASHQKFLLETIRKLEELKELVNVDEEVAMLKKQLT
ncbi:GSCFA domain-containing protein [Chryseolinea sp. H1M3-3]|uniref:GSCFA domain-containing protein n=1 Tax=Chryseolinea sp. H1M3-3 TaxID=3034144 RepID=UPI0032095FE4